MNYIIIFEDGMIFKSDSFGDNEKNAAAEGLIDVIRQDDLKIWVDDEWTDMQEWGGE